MIHQTYSVIPMKAVISQHKKLGVTARIRCGISSIFLDLAFFNEKK